MRSSKYTITRIEYKIHLFNKADLLYIRRTQEHTVGWIPENTLCIFLRRNLSNGAKLHVKMVNCAKKDSLPLMNFRLGRMRISVGNTYSIYLYI